MTCTLHLIKIDSHVCVCVGRMPLCPSSIPHVTPRTVRATATRGQTVADVASMRRTPSHRLLRWLFGFVLFVLRSYGFWPYYYDAGRRAYRTNWLLLGYPLLTLAGGLYLFDRVAGQIFRQASFLFSTETAVLLLRLFRGVSAVAFGCNYLLQYRRFAEIERIWQCGARLVRDIFAELPTTTDTARTPPSYGRLIGVFLLKSWALPSAFALLELVALYRFSPVVREQPWMVLVLETAFFIIGVATNAYVAAMLAAGHLFDRLNEETAAVAASAAELFRPLRPLGRTPFAAGRAQRFGALSERMDRLAELHRRLCRLTGRVHSVFSASVAVYVLYRMLDVVLRAFVAYVFSVQWQLLTLLSEDGEFPLLVVVCDALMSVLDGADLMVLAWVCTEAGVQVSGVGNVVAFGCGVAAKYIESATRLKIIQRLYNGQQFLIFISSRSVAC